MAGHSRWARVKHKKALTDAKRGELFSKIIKEIAVAVRAGGADSGSNTRLRTALERARSNGLPKENVERAILRSSGGGGPEALQEFLYEAASPGGVAILIEGITDNKNRSIAEIKHLLAEYRAKLARPGSMLWNFEKAGVHELDKRDNKDKTKEDVELAIVESGARDFRATDEGWLVETDFISREGVRKNLEKEGLKIKESGYDYKPRSYIELSPEKYKELEALLDALTDHADIQEVYTNLKE